MRDEHRVKFVREELFDERNDLISAQVNTLFSLRMDEKNRAVDFSFSDKGTTMSSDEFYEIGRGVPGVEDNGFKGKILINGIQDEIFGQIEFAFEVLGFSIRDIGFKV